MYKGSFYNTHSFRGSLRTSIMDDFGNLHLIHRGRVEYFISQDH